MLKTGFTNWINIQLNVGKHLVLEVAVMLSLRYMPVNQLRELSVVSVCGLNEYRCNYWLQHNTSGLKISCLLNSSIPGI